MSKTSLRAKLKRLIDFYALKIKTIRLGANLTLHSFGVLEKADSLFSKYGCKIEKMEPIEDGGIRVMWVHDFVVIYAEIENHDSYYCRVISLANSAELLELDREDFAGVISDVYLGALEYARHTPSDFGIIKDGY